MLGEVSSRALQDTDLIGSGGRRVKDAEPHERWCPGNDGGDEWRTGVSALLMFARRDDDDVADDVPRRRNASLGAWRG